MSIAHLDSAENFLLDAKRTKDANSGQHGGELVHLLSLTSREPEVLRTADSGRCFDSMRVLREGLAQPGAAAA